MRLETKTLKKAWRRFYLAIGVAGAIIALFPLAAFFIAVTFFFFIFFIIFGAGVLLMAGAIAAGVATMALSAKANPLKPKNNPAIDTAKNRFMKPSLNFKQNTYPEATTPAPKLQAEAHVLVVPDQKL